MGSKDSKHKSYEKKVYYCSKCKKCSNECKSIKEHCGSYCSVSSTESDDSCELYTDMNDIIYEYYCDECKKCIKNKDKLKVHMREHYEHIYTLNIEVCNKMIDLRRKSDIPKDFDYGYHIKNHQQMRSNCIVKEYCNVCKIYFMHKKNSEEHIYEKHLPKIIKLKSGLT